MITAELKSGKDKSVLRQHPWIYSGAVKGYTGQPEEGDLVEVTSKKGRYLATGHYAGGNIAIRVLSFEDDTIDQDFWNERIQRAYEVRQQLGFVDNPDTNAYRLSFAEGDRLPGLIMDVYNGHVVLQTSTMGMQRAIPQIITALQSCYGDALKSIYNKSSKSLKTGNVVDGTVHGDSLDGDTVLENGMQFAVNWKEGQKTGFFLDQRDNRDLLRKLSKGKRVLNTFCYSGGFSVAAYKGGASEVVSVDSSAGAIKLCEENLELNGLSMDGCVVIDTMEYLKGLEETFDIIVLDPPAYAKSLQAKHRAVQGYKRLNAIAMGKLNPGGLLFTFSCSGVINRPLFENTVISAAIAAGKNGRILHHLSQPADHPVNIHHPEGEYLKGLVLEIE